MKFPKEYEYRGGQRDLAKAIGVSRAAVGEARKLSDIVEELLTALKAKGL